MQAFEGHGGRVLPLIGTSLFLPSCKTTDLSFLWKFVANVPCLCSSCTLTRYLDLVVEVCLPGSMPIEKAIFPALSSQHGCEQICKRAI